MTKRTRTQFLLALASLATAASVSACNPLAAFHPTTQPTTGVVCYEDQPCWDCTSMGNRICGPTR